MNVLRRRAVALLMLGGLCLNASTAFAVPPVVSLIGKGSVSGNASDLSGLTGNYCQAGSPANCVPKNIFGGFGSDLGYTGFGDIFVAAPDRGPFDGLTDVPYLDRFHYLRIETRVGEPFPNIDLELLRTKFLKNQFGQTYLGAAGAFGTNDRFNLRFDPEGIRVGFFGTLFISDEYGPYIREFTRSGRLLRSIRVPSKFAIANPNADPNTELLSNTAGRQANRGMEGLAISPNGRYLFGMMQNALLQDNGLNPGTVDRLGLNNRILRIDLLTGRTNEYVYQLEAINRGQGACEILAINDSELLVLDRDNRSNLQTPPQAPTRKKIYKINVTGASDVSNIASLPAGTTLPPGVTPVAKEVFIDLLDPVFNLTPTIAEKIEGLAWGPNLPDGRHVLYVISDNDLNPAIATQIYSFAINPTIDYERQFILLPVFFPWEFDND